MEKISVIVPTYKRFNLLPRALNSIIKQTYKNLEIIVVDDNDPNDEYRNKTREIMKDYVEKYGIIYVENKKNVGVSETRNVGISIATGEYITFLDDDDEYLEEKVSTQYLFMKENSLDLCLCDGAIYSDSNKLLKLKKRNIILDMTSEELLRIHLTEHITGTNTMMFRTAFLREIGGFGNYKAAEEFHLTTSAILNGAKIGNISRPLTKSYLHKGEHLTTSMAKINSENELYEIKKVYFNRLSKKDVKIIKCRHFITLGYAYYKMKKFFLAFFNVFRACVISIRFSVRLFKENKNKL